MNRICKLHTLELLKYCLLGDKILICKHSHADNTLFHVLGYKQMTVFKPNQILCCENLKKKKEKERKFKKKTCQPKRKEKVKFLAGDQKPKFEMCWYVCVWGECICNTCESGLHSHPIYANWGYTVNQAFPRFKSATSPFKWFSTFKKHLLNV